MPGKLDLVSSPTFLTVQCWRVLTASLCTRSFFVVVSRGKGEGRKEAVIFPPAVTAVMQVTCLARTTPAIGKAWVNKQPFFPGAHLLFLGSDHARICFSAASHMPQTKRVRKCLAGSHRSRPTGWRELISQLIPREGELLLPSPLSILVPTYVLLFLFLVPALLLFHLAELNWLTEDLTSTRAGKRKELGTDNPEQGETFAFKQQQAIRFSRNLLTA